MAESTNGIEAMRQRMARASRKPPPARRQPPPDQSSEPRPAAEETPAQSVSTSAPRRAPRARQGGERVSPEAPPVNLAIRVRRPLDDRLADVIHALRGRGVRTSKVELIEMLLWELPAGVADDDLLRRLGRFRNHAPRSMAAAMPGDLPE